LHNTSPQFPITYIVFPEDKEMVQEQHFIKYEKSWIEKNIQWRPNDEGISTGRRSKTI
jgi:hypothetical protein